MPPPRSLGNSRSGSSPVQARTSGWARRVHQVSSWKPNTQSGAPPPARSARHAVFFCAYWGSGLTSQCLARFQPTPRRFRARRRVSRLRRCVVQPFSWQTSAANSSVHRLVGLPRRAAIDAARHADPRRGLWARRHVGRVESWAFDAGSPAPRGRRHVGRRGRSACHNRGRWRSGKVVGPVRCATGPGSDAG